MPDNNLVELGRDAHLFAPLFGLHNARLARVPVVALARLDVRLDARLAAAGKRFRRTLERVGAALALLGLRCGADKADVVGEHGVGLDFVETIVEVTGVV